MKKTIFQNIFFLWPGVGNFAAQYLAICLEHKGLWLLESSLLLPRDPQSLLQGTEDGSPVLTPSWFSSSLSKSRKQFNSGYFAACQQTQEASLLADNGSQVSA